MEERKEIKEVEEKKETHNPIEKTEEKLETKPQIMEEKKPETPFEKKPKKGVGGFFRFIKKNWTWIVLILFILIIILSISMRTSNISELKDVTTGNYTLGPDLDPYFFMRVGKEMAQYGNPLNPDMLRAAPLGMDPSYNLHSRLMGYFYKFLTIFDKNVSFEFASIIFPVVFFTLALGAFFLLSRKLFSKITSKKKADIAALISTAFLAVIPDMLHRTVAGIPEHESSGIFFFFLAFYLFLLAWESKGKKSILFSILAGITTGLMISAWGGGSKYIFMVVGLAMFLAFLFKKIQKKQVLMYIIFLIFSMVSAVLVDKSFSLKLAVTELPNLGFALIILFVLIVDFLLFNTKIKKIFKKIKIPKPIISLIIAIILGIIIFLIVNPSFFFNMISELFHRLLYPFGTGRIGLTVAENRQPYLVDLIGSFSPIIFWLFIIGTVVIFYESITHFTSKKVKTSLLIGFIIFVVLLLFSRYSSGSVFNGENLISQILYFVGPIVFIFIIFYNLIASKGEKREDFKKIKFSNIFLLVMLFWTFISVRGAVRLFFVISPFLIMSLSLLPLKISDYAKSKDDLRKVISIGLVIVICILLLLAFLNYQKQTATAAKYTIPSSYNQQWQKAMGWVRENTSENAIFSHWWDYGYWVHSLGKRPTILDGGHHTPFWNHLFARYVLTGRNETEALEFLYAHNTSYLLIDSTDIGKYTAYSSIGSNETGSDKLSWINVFRIDESQTYETRNETQYIYVGGTLFDKDIEYKGQIFPMSKSGIGAIILKTNNEQKVVGVESIVINSGQQYRLPMRYFFFNEQLYDFGGDPEDTLQGCAYVIPSLEGNSINQLGAIMYLSEKALDALWVKLYLFGEGEYFKVAHKQDSFVIDELKNRYEYELGDFLYTGQVNGPITIWKINYPENFEVPEDKMKRYLSRVSDLSYIR